MFYNSCWLITAISSTGSVIAVKTSWRVNSIIFIEFLKKLVRFINNKELVDPRRCLILLDNASIHRSKSAMTYFKNESLSVAFIPQYSPELVTIERYFSKLKQDVIQKSKGKKMRIGRKQSQINWSEARC